MLTEGTKAPNFSLPESSGGTFSTRAHKGSWLVVYFYPKDNTPGCTREAQDFNASIATFRKLDATLVGISKDTIKSHCTFRDKFALKFPLASDTDLSVQKAFGAYGKKVLYGKEILGTIRCTFIISPKGVIARVFAKVKVDGHVDEVLSALKELQKT